MRDELPRDVQAPVQARQPVEVRVQQFKHELLANRIDLKQLRRLAIHGVPDRDGLRALTWKLLLGYLPVEPDDWDAILAHKRTQYLLFCEELIIDPKKAGGSVDGPDLQQDGALYTEDITSADHPLSVSNDSMWNKFFKDNEILEQVDRDVMRTHPDLHFFSGETVEAERHRAEIKRALFLYAKLNPGLRYIQGMNELYAPLYFQFANDVDPTSARHAEADAFYCFVELLSEFRDHFCQQLDNSTSGIKATIRKLLLLLRYHDSELAAHLEQQRIDPHFFAFRWITLLLTQEFPFPDAVRLWDTILSDPQGRLDCLMRICTAMLLLVREKLMAGDFACNVKLLQRYPSVDVNLILHKAASLPPCAFVLEVPL